MSANEICARLVRQSNAVAAVLCNESRAIASAGKPISPTTLESVRALLELDKDLTGKLGDLAFHVTRIDRNLLVVLFDENSSLGLVRLRVRKALEELTDLTT